MQIEMEWKGRQYVVPENRAFELGEMVEDIITLAELPEFAARPKFRKIARVYGAMLRFAGAKCTDEEVHSAIMAEIKTGSERQELATRAITMLVDVLMDGAPTNGGAETGKKESAS
jgi:hypothetical protein